MSIELVMLIVPGIIAAGTMLGIGIYQINAKNPVGFYTGEKKFEARELTNVHAWNVSHGVMWLVYGIIIAAGFTLCALMMESILCIIPLFVSILVPVPFMILIHHRLIKKYKIV